jgi:putative transposase
MPRQQRLVVPEVPLHIIQRGNDRMACFRQERDYLVYLALLQQASEGFGCAVHAYCLMTNHIHLLLTAGSSDACAALMHGLAHRYAQYFNREHKRTGTLWDGRYRSCLVESSSYILACYRYIELNPVRAGMVSHPKAYRWSSYAANSGARTDRVVSPHAEFSALPPAAYVDLLDAAVEPALLVEIRDATNSGYPLATESFKIALSTVTGRKTGPGRAGRPVKRGAARKLKLEPDPDLFSGGGVS